MSEPSRLLQTKSHPRRALPFGALFLALLGSTAVLFGQAELSGSSPRRPEVLPSAALARVESRLAGKELVIRWTTEQESGNAGFRLWGIDARGQRTLLARVASQEPDALAPRTYERRVSPAYGRFEIEEVSLFGPRRVHGPFRAGTTVGANLTRPGDGWPRPTGPMAGATAVERSIAWRWVVESEGESTASVHEALLGIDRPGIYRLTYEELLSDGIDLRGVAPRAIAIVDDGQGVPRRVETVGATFGPGGVIEFVGRPTLTISSPVDLYELLVDTQRAVDVAPLLAPEAPVGVVEATFEAREDRLYSYSAPDGDPWYERGLLAWGAPAVFTKSFDLPDLVGGAAELDLFAWGYGDFAGAAPDHHVMAFLNGVQVASESFDGVAPWSATVDVGMLLRSTGNVLEFRVPGDTGYAFDNVAFEGFSVRYPRLAEASEGVFHGVSTATGSIGIGGFDVPDLISIWYFGANGVLRGLQASVGGEVFAPGGGELFAASASAILRPVVTAGLPAAQASSSAEYLIVSHPAFASELGDLVALEQSRGLTTEVVTVDSIYAAYSDHATSAAAIRSFLGASLATGETRFVLLVGADTVDPYDHLGTGSTSFVPTEYRAYVQYFYFLPTDEALVDVDADDVGEVPIGRLPVRSTSETAAAVAKIVAQAENEGSTPRLALLASGISDFGRYFAEINEGFEQAMGSWGIYAAAADDLGSAGARSALLAGLNSGIGLVSYFGHASIGQWDNTPMLSLTDVDLLANQGSPNLVANWGCWGAYHVSPTSESLAAKLVRAEGRGAAGAIGAVGPMVDVYQQMLGQYFFQHVEEGLPTVGEALHAAKVSLSSEAGSEGSLLGVVLLGDPAMRWPNGDSLTGGSGDPREPSL